MTPDEIARATDTQALWQQLREAEDAGDDRRARLLRERLDELVSPQQAPNARRSGTDETIMPGSYYQDNQVTWPEVLGILGVIVLLGAVAWFVIPRGGSGVVTRGQVVEAGGEWPLPTVEVRVTCAGDSPVYELSSGGGTTQFSDDVLVEQYGPAAADVRAAARSICTG